MPSRRSFVLARLRALVVAATLVASVGACAACGSALTRPVVRLRPDETVIVRFDPTRTLTFERRLGDTVRIERVSSVIGHLRREHGDTSWLAATLVRRIDEDRPVPLSRWNTTIVADGSTRVVALSQDPHTSRSSWEEFGALLTILGVAAGTVLVLYIHAGPHG